LKLVGSSSQIALHSLYDASGTIAAGGTAQLVLAQSMMRSHLVLGNNSNDPLWFEFGSARATCSLTGGSVSSFSITNGGFGFTRPPNVILLGGGAPPGQTTGPYLGLNQPNGFAPSHVAKAHAVLVGGAVSSFVIDNPGANYQIAPYVFMYNDSLDPYGCAVPSTNVGVLIPSGAPPLIYNGTVCPTDPIAVYGATTGDAFLCKWMD
jgi:hypothetical protein